MRDLLQNKNAIASSSFLAFNPQASFVPGIFGLILAIPGLYFFQKTYGKKI